MDPRSLSPPPKGSTSLESKSSQIPADSVDGLTYNWTSRNPGREATSPKEPSNPSPVELQEPLLDLASNVTYEDQDRVFVQASPHIFQRKQGGWNAKLPEVESTCQNYFRKRSVLKKIENFKRARQSKDNSRAERRTSRHDIDEDCCLIGPTCYAPQDTLKSFLRKTDRGT